MSITLQQELERLKKKIEYFEKDASFRGFFCLNRLVNQQVDLLNDWEIKGNISGKKSEDATFERMQSLWKGLPELISELNKLRIELKVDGEDEEEKIIPISAKAIANGEV